MEENNDTAKVGQVKEHYVCKGGCKGVSETPGTCGAEDCASYERELEKCICTDGFHNGFE